MVKRPESFMNFPVNSYSIPMTVCKFHSQVEVFQMAVEGHKLNRFVPFHLSTGSFLLCMCVCECGSSVHADKRKLGKQEQPQLKHFLVSFSKFLHSEKPVV